MVDFVTATQDEAPRKKIDFNAALSDAEKIDAARDKAFAGLVGQRELGEPGLKSSIARFNLARADNLKEKVNVFKQQFPEGELIQSPGESKELLFREDPSQPFRKVEGPEFEPINDIIDFIGGDVGPIVGEIGATILTRGTNLLPMMFAMFAGAATGELAEQGIQEIEGIQEQGLGEVVTQAAGEGVVSGVFGGLGVLGGKAIDVARGGGLLTLRPGAAEAMSATERLQARTGIEIPGLTPGQASDNPLIQKIEGQAGATLPTLERYFNAQNEAAKSVLTAIRNKPEAKKLLQGSLETLHNKEKRNILTAVIRDTVELGAGGEAIQKGIKAYDVGSRYLVNEAYDKARAIDTPSFDITDLKNLAGQLEAGAQVPTEEGVQRLGFSLSGDLKEVIDQIKTLDPALPEGTTASGQAFTATDQLRQLRTMLWDLKTTPPGTVLTPEHRKMTANATELYSEITRTLKSPVNPDPRFKKAWDKANKIAEDRFSTKEKIMFLQAVKSETPTLLADRVLKPKQVENLRLLRKVMPNEDFKVLQQTFKKKLIESGDILREMGKFDGPTMNILLSPLDQKILKQVGTNLKKLDDIGIQKTLERQSKTGAAIKELLFREDTARLEQFANLIKKQGKESKIGREIRSGLIDSIADDVIKRTDGVAVVDSKKLSSMMTILREKGLTRFLTVSDIKTLRDLDKVIPFLSQKADMGTSQQAGSAARGVAGALTGDITFSAVKTLMENFGIGRISTSHLGQFLFRGTGKPKTDKQILALMGAITGTLITDLK